MAVATRDFGKTSDGESVQAFMLEAGDLRAEVLSYGATIRTFEHAGVDVMLGHDDLAPYLGRHPYFGSTVGRVAGRIGDGSFELDGRQFRLEPNELPAMKNHIHGGKDGWDRRVWAADVVGDSVKFSLVSPDGDNGYPGRVEVTVTYRLDRDGLSIDYEATTDQPTPIAPTNHAYFNLAGHDAGKLDGHVIEIHADRVALTDETLRYTGGFVDVEATAEDLRRPTDLAVRRSDLFQQHGSTYEVRGEPGTLRRAADVVHREANRRLVVQTTESCLQLYTTSMLDELNGKGGTHYPAFSGFCLEAQAFADLMHLPVQVGPRRAILRPGERYRQTTRYDLGAL